jgi:hypothetical protein
MEMTESNTLRGTTAHSPDLSWSQVRETVLMLELAAGQIEAAMRDSGSSVDVLTDSFTHMASSMQMISETVAALPDEGDNSEMKQALLGAAGQVSGMVHQAIIAFQFYDKLAQRLAHVTHSLGGLSELVTDKGRIFNPQEWVDLQGRIRAKYTTADECEMFEAVMRGVPVAVAIEQYVEAMKNKQSDGGSDDIELF